MLGNNDNRDRIGMPVEDWKRELCEVFYARIGIILLTTAVIFAGAILVTLFVAPTYSISGSVVVRAKRPQISPDLLESTDVRIQTVAKEDLLTEAAILGSNDLVRLTIDRMRAEGKEVPLNSGGITSRLSSFLSLLSRAKLDKANQEVLKVKRNLHTNILAASNVVEVSMEGRDPEVCTKFVSTLLDEYMKYRAGVYNPGAETVFFSDRAKHYRDQLEQVEKRLADAATTASMTLVDREMTNNLDLKKELTGQLSLLKRQYSEKERETSPLTKAVNSNDVKYFAFLDNETVRLLSTELVRLEAARAQALSEFLPNSDKIRKMDANIRAVYNPLRAEVQSILDSKKSELAGLDDSIQQLEKQIANLDGRNLSLQQHITKYNGDMREADLLKTSYETFSKRSEESAINNAITKANLSGDVSVLSKPESSIELVFPRPLLTPLLGLLAGIFASFGLALTSEYMDHRIRRPADVTRHLGLPVIGSIRKLQ